MFWQMLKSAHFYKTWAHAFAAALLAAFIGAGIATGGVFTTLFDVAAFSFLMLLGGLGSTIFARGFFGLAQVGIIIQLVMFFISGIIAAYITALILPMTVMSYACVSATTILGYILLAVPTGHISQYANRSWLPVWMPKS